MTNSMGLRMMSACCPPHELTDGAEMLVSLLPQPAAAAAAVSRRQRDAVRE